MDDLIDGVRCTVGANKGCLNERCLKDSVQKTVFKRRRSKMRISNGGSFVSVAIKI